jgi:thioesterase domain-containing protein
MLPLFLIHPIGGEVQYAFDLARCLDAELPVYGLAASGLAAGEVPDASIAAMASAYLQAMREVQPSGPYRVAGWSLGGIVAYEIAQQLDAAGETVDFLGMIDSGSSGLLRSQLSADRIDEGHALLHWLADHQPELADADLQPLFGELTRLAQRKEVDAMIALCQARKIFPTQVEVDMLKRILAVYRAGAGAALDYHAPQPVTPVTLFTAERGTMEDATLGWGDLLGDQLQVRPIGGTHASIVRTPHVEKLGRAIFQAIAGKKTQVDSNK